MERHRLRSVDAGSQALSGDARSALTTALAKAAAQGIQLNDSNSPATFTQSNSDIAQFSGGSAVVVWEDNRNGDWDIFAQALNPDGSANGANLDLIPDPDFHDQRQPQIAINSSDVALLVYNDETSGEIYGLILNSALSVVSGPFLLTDAPSGTKLNMPALAPLSGNRFIVVWEDGRSGANIFGQIVAGDGSLDGSNFPINSGGATAFRISPDVISSLNGDFAVVWEEPATGNPDIMFRLFTDVGTPIFPEVQLGLAHSAATQIMPKVSYLSSQDYLVGWISDRYGEQSVWLQRMTTSSTEADTSIRANDNADNISWDLDFAQTSTGGAVALWTDYSGSNSIKLQQINANGSLISNNLMLEDSGLTHERDFPSAVCNSAGCRVAWADQRNGNFDIYMQVLDDVFLKQGQNLLLNNDASGAQQTQPDIALVGTNASGVVWTDRRNDDGDIYYRVVSQAGDLTGGEIRLNDDTGFSLQNKPRIAGNRNGKGVVVWSDGRSDDVTSTQKIMGQLVTSTPTVQGSNFAVTNDISGAPKTDADVAMAPDGAFAVVWTDRRDGSQQVYLQGYDASNAAVGSNIRLSGIVSTTGNFLPSVSIAPDHSGVAAWLAIDGGQQVIYYQPFDQNFDPVGANQLLPAPAGGTISDVGVYDHSASGIMYFSYLRQTTDAQQVEAMAIDQSGSIVWGPTILNEDLEASVAELRMAGSSTAVGVAWSDYRTGVERTWLQLVNLDGTLIMSNQTLSGLTEAAREMQPAVALGESYFYSTWVDNRNAGEGYDVFFTNDEFTATDVNDDLATLPDQFELNQNFPNPFNPETIISYSLAAPQHVKLTIYNTLGQRVRVLVDDWQLAGLHRVRWDGTSSAGKKVASGVYLYRLETATAVQTRKMTLLK